MRMGHDTRISSRRFFFGMVTVRLRSASWLASM
jgi:hypothetical protein